MKIGVVSDTHSLEVPKQLLEEFRGVDLIIHAGDFCTPEDYGIFSKLKETHAVFGNMDNGKIRKELPEKKILTLEGVKVGITHGEGPAKKVLEGVQKAFKNDGCQVVVFGHSHCPCNEKIGNCLFFNPGSPNDKVIAPYCSYGILEIHKGAVVGKIVKVKEK